MRVRAARRRAEQELEAIVQPLTALVARVEVVQELALLGELDDLVSQFTAIQASAERLVSRVRVARGAVADSFSAPLPTNAALASTSANLEAEPG